MAPASVYGGSCASVAMAALKARQVAQRVAPVLAAVRAKTALANYGLRLSIDGVSEAEEGDPRKDPLSRPVAPGMPRTWRQHYTELLARLWVERWTVSNAILFRKDREFTVPPMLLPVEQVSWELFLGREVLVYNLPQTYHSGQFAELFPELIARLKTNRRLQLNPAQGEHWHVWRAVGLQDTTLDLPELLCVFFEAAQWENMARGESLLSEACRSPLLMHLLGYEITGGSNAGLNFNHAKPEDVEAIKNLRIPTSSRDKMSEHARNFDYDHKWIYPPKELFDGDRWQGVRQRLADWAGPVGTALFLDQANTTTMPVLMRLAHAEMEQERSQIKDPAERFLGAALPQQASLRIHWGHRCFLDARIWAEMLRVGLAAGPISPQTYNEETGHDDDREMQRKTADLNRRPARLPLFDAAHGDQPGVVADSGGRPPGTPDPTE